MLVNKIILVLAVLVGLVFVAQAYSPDEGTFTPIFYSGKIVGIDPTYKTLTIQADPKDEANFTVSEGASLVVCGKEVSFNDLKVGETVRIAYYTENLGSSRFVTDLKAKMTC